MKQRLKRLLVHLLSLLPGKPVILLESAPPLGDNTGALYRELLAQGWNDRYRSYGSCRIRRHSGTCTKRTSALSARMANGH